MRGLEAGAIVRRVAALCACAVFAVFASALAALLAPAQAATDGAPRVALVIGNAQYKTMPLGNPVNDARAIADALGKMGFKVVVLHNASQKQMVDATRQFGEALRSGIGLFYYAGHGMQVKGRNYLIPVDAAIDHEDEVAYKAFDVNLVLEKMETAKNPLNIVILDACRNNPFARATRSASRGLAQMDAPTGAIVAFATAPGAEAADGSGANGLYTSYLLKHMSTPGLKVEDVFKRTRVAVKQESGGRQIPWESTSLEGDFYFQPPAAGGASEPTNAAAVENELWAVISQSNSPSAYRAYLEKYPNGRYAQQAQARAAPATQTVAAAPTAAPPAGPAPAPAPAARSQGGFSFSAEEEKMDRASPDGRVQAAQQAIAATACAPAMRNARVRLQLQEERGGAFGVALGDQLRRAGLRVQAQGAADYVLQATVTSQAGRNRRLALNELALNTALTLTSAQGRTVSSHLLRDESYAGSDLQGSYLDLVRAQASDAASRVFADLCQR